MSDSVSEVPATDPAPDLAAPDLNRIMQYLEAIDQKLGAIDQKTDTILDDVNKTNTIREDIKSLIKSESLDSSVLLKINAKLTVITDAMIASGHPDLRDLIDEKRAEARNSVF